MVVGSLHSFRPRSTVQRLASIDSMAMAVLMVLVVILAPNADVISSAAKACRLTIAKANTSPPQETDTRIRDIIDSGELSILRWPDFSDYRAHLKRFYESSGYSPAWVRESQPTRQARSLIEILKQADNKGLNAEDYDAKQWDARLQELNDPVRAARFDAALSVCIMRYISDLRIGRVNPRHFSFGINVERKKYDLAEFVRSRLADGDDIQTALGEVEPPFPGYQRTLTALQRYLELSQKDSGEKLPELAKKVVSGEEYAGISRLTQLLRLFGDLPATSDVPHGNIYEGAITQAVAAFQRRHGLTADGVLGTQTIKQLNVPVGQRVEQLRLALERWRWVPMDFPQPPVVVNIPEFRLRAFDGSGRVVLSANVVVGKAYRHETPVFEDEMQYVVFRPYWNVPPSIQRSEIVPAIRRDRNYASKHNYEVITSGGTVVPSGTISDEILQKLSKGALATRQKPGPDNALGLVKLIFPNAHNVYLHSTPSQQLFARSRRDFSHGCIRVEKAAELAAWALSGNKEDWTLKKVQATMQGPEDNVQINLAKPIPVLILYATAIVDENGVAYFFEDVYGYDAELERTLAKGYPYPG